MSRAGKCDDHCVGYFTIFYNTIPAPTGTLPSRSGRPGPNVGSGPVVDGSVVNVPSAIYTVIVVVVIIRTSTDRTANKKLIMAGVRIGVALGPAVTIFVVGSMDTPGVPRTGTTLITARPPTAVAAKEKPKHDDVSDVPGAYGTGGTSGLASIGAPVIRHAIGVEGA